MIASASYCSNPVNMRYLARAKPFRLSDLFLFVIFFALIFYLRERDIEFVVEPDFWSAMISAWRNFLGTGHRAALPVPFPYPYLDTPYIFYATTAKMLRMFVVIFPRFSHLFPNQDSYNIASALITNSIAYSAACCVFFRMMLRLTGGVLFSLVLALTLFLSPPMLDIDLVRVDYLNILFVIILFFGGFLLALREETAFLAVILGIVLALVSTTKINGCAFGVFIAIGFMVRLCDGRLSLQTRHVVYFFSAFIISLSILMYRFLSFFSLSEIITDLIGCVERVALWFGVVVFPMSFYSVDLFLGHGLPFIILYLAASAFVVWQAIIRREPVTVYFAVSFLLFSAIGLVVFRYSRGGYHLLPIYLANIGLAVTILRRNPKRSIGVSGLIGIAMAILILSGIPLRSHYLRIAHDMKARSAAVDQIRRAPWIWLKSHVPAGSKICIYADSAWALPPIFDLPAAVTDAPFKFPYLDERKMVEFSPPDLSTLNHDCDFVVLNDYHVRSFTGQMKALSPEQGARWESFLSELQKSHPAQVFQSDVPILGVSAVEIHQLN
jgi:hypothetical protein